MTRKENQPVPVPKNEIPQYAYRLPAITTVSELRTHQDKILAQVQDGVPMVLTNHGRAVAVLCSLDAFREMNLKAYEYNEDKATIDSLQNEIEKLRNQLAQNQEQDKTNPS